MASHCGWNSYLAREETLCSPYSIPSGQKCYLCLRYILLPMCPGRTKIVWLLEPYSNLQPIG